MVSCVYINVYLYVYNIILKQNLVWESINFQTLFRKHIFRLIRLKTRAQLKFSSIVLWKSFKQKKKVSPLKGYTVMTLKIGEGKLFFNEKNAHAPVYVGEISCLSFSFSEWWIWSLFLFFLSIASIMYRVNFKLRIFRDVKLF